MSVAFRRDSDEEHREPRFELPLPPGPNPVTRRGLALIEARIAALDADLAAATLEAREAVLRDLRYWRTRLATARVVPVASGRTVAIGTRVMVERDGARRVIEIVGHDEGDAASARVGFAAPLARALIGAEVGDEVEAPGGGVMHVVAIEITPD